MGRRVSFDMSRVQVFTYSYWRDEKRVRDLVDRCICPLLFPMVKVGEGKYQVGDSPTLLYVRVLRNHVMVRVGGGWETLENYLNRHDPCRCQFHEGHRGGASRNSAAGHQNIPRQSSTTSPISFRASTASPLPTTPRKTPSMASVSPSQSGLKGSHSEHVSFTKGPSPSPSTTAERLETPSTAEPRPKTPVLTLPRPQTPAASSFRSKIPVASIQPEVKDSSTPQTPSETPTAVNNHSNAGSSSNVGVSTRASSADAGYCVTTTVHVNSDTVTSVTCADAPSHVETNIRISSPDCRVKNSSFVHTSVDSSNYGHTQVTDITVQSQCDPSSSDDERQSESSETAEEGNQKQTVSVSVSRSPDPVSSGIPKPSFIPRATAPVSPSCSVSQEPGRSNGSLVARGGRARPSARVGRSSVERRLSAEKGDEEKQTTTPRRRPQTPNYSRSSAPEGNRVKRAQTPGLENSSSLASSGMRTPRGATSPRPEVSSRKPKTNPGFGTLRRDLQKKKENKLHHRRSPSLTADVLQTVEAVSEEIHKESSSLNKKNGSTPGAVSTNTRSKKQKARDPEVLMISRNSQGLHRVHIPDQNELSASPQTRRKLQPSTSLDVLDRMRRRTPEPVTEYQPRSILRKPAQPAQKESDIYACNVTSRTEAWVDSALHDPEPERISHLRQPGMTPNSLSITESELLSRPLEEIQAALPSPTEVPQAVDLELMYVPPADPEMYIKMEMLLEKYREMELRVLTDTEHSRQ